MSQNGHSSLPKCTKTLVKTPCSVSCVGVIMHILVYQMVSRSTNIRSTNPQIDPDIISLQVNIDGIPLYKSSSQVWPILASLEGLTPLSLECLLGIISYQM